MGRGIPCRRLGLGRSRTFAWSYGSLPTDWRSVALPPRSLHLSAGRGRRAEDVDRLPYPDYIRAVALRVLGGYGGHRDCRESRSPSTRRGTACGRLWWTRTKGRKRPALQCGIRRIRRPAVPQARTIAFAPGLQSRIQAQVQRRGQPASGVRIPQRAGMVAPGTQRQQADRQGGYA